MDEFEFPTKSIFYQYPAYCHTNSEVKALDVWLKSFEKLSVDYMQTVQKKHPVVSSVDEFIFSILGHFLNGNVCVGKKRAQNLY